MNDPAPINRIQGNVLAAAEREIATHLAPAAQSAFNEGRKQSQTAFTQMEGDLAQTRTQAKVDQEKERGVLQKKLADDRVKFTESQTALEVKAKASKARYDAEEAQVGPMLTQLRNQLGALQAAARPRVDELQRLSFDIDGLLADADQAPDAGSAGRLRFQADRLRARSRVVRQELAELNASIGQVQVRGQGLENRLAAAASRYQAESKQFNAEAARLQKIEKTLGVTERTLDQPVTGNTPKATSLASRLRAFSTYEPFAMNEERERVLESVGK